jgi:dienelactone hydrolase
MKMQTPLVIISLGFLLLACAQEESSVASSTPREARLSLAELSMDGPFEIRTYSSFPDVPEFADATIYYPLNTRQPIGGVAVAPGFTERQRHINWWGPRLASHGYAVLVLDTNDPRERPDVRADALMAAVASLRAENNRDSSPLYGRIDVNKMAIMGHSMGGGGVLLAANAHSDLIQAAIPFTPWQPEADFSAVTVPTLVIAGSADRIAAVDQHAWLHFQSIPETTAKVYLEIDGGDHFIANSGQHRDKATMGRFAIAWLKLYLDGDDRYGEYIYGETAELDAGKFSRYVTNP